MQVETRQDDASKMRIHLFLGCQTHPCVLMKNREVYFLFFRGFFAGRFEWNLAKSGRSFHSVGLLSELGSPCECLIS